MGRLEGKRAIVTGASSGIGRAIANRFAAEGATVAACGRDAERVHRTVEEIRRAGGTAVGLLGDVATEEGARSVADGAAQELGGVDVLINNAGVDASDWRDHASAHRFKQSGADDPSWPLRPCRSAEAQPRRGRFPAAVSRASRFRRPG